jgi:integrase
MPKTGEIPFNHKSLDALRQDAMNPEVVNLSDPKTRGLWFRMTKTGVKTFSFVYRMRATGAKVEWLTIAQFDDMPLERVRQLAVRYRGWIDEGINPKEKLRQKVTPGLTVADVAKRFLEEYATPINLKPKTILDYGKTIDNHILPALGKKKIKDLNFEILSAWHKGIPSKNGRGKVAANRALRTLSSICTQAEGWEYIPVGANPCKLVKMFPEVARQRDIQPEELNAVGDALNKLYASKTLQKRRDSGGKYSSTEDERNSANIWALAAIKIIALCAGRINEVLHFRRDADVFLDKGYAIIREHKTSGSVGIKRMELPNAAVEILKVLPEMRGNPWYFPRADSTDEPITDSAVRKVWNKICTMAGVEDLHLQDFRSFAASESHENDLDILTASKILGHKDSRTTEKHYLKVRMSKVTEAAEIVSAPVAKAFRLGRRQGSEES